MNKPSGVIEKLNEGWVYFTRFHMKEGFIDFWHGDASNNPNGQHESPYQLNTFMAFYRLNGEKWISHSNFHKGFFGYIQQNHRFSTAQEVWTKHFKLGHTHK